MERSQLRSANRCTPGVPVPCLNRNGADRGVRVSGPQPPKLKIDVALEFQGRAGRLRWDNFWGRPIPERGGVQIGAFFDRRLCNARRFAWPRYLLVCEYHVSDWQIRNQSGSISLAPLPGGDWRDSWPHSGAGAETRSTLGSRLVDGVDQEPVLSCWQLSSE
jgi:hypothetical protein